VRLLARLVVAALVAGAVPVLSGSVLLGAQVATSCTPAQVSLTATTSQTVYVARENVLVTVALHNHGAEACTYVLGPTSPNYVVKDSSGATVWGSCWFDGGPAPCAMYVLQRVLASGATYRDRLSWNQLSGHPEIRVPAGRYRFSVTLSDLASRAATTFRLAAS